MARKQKDDGVLRLIDYPLDPRRVTLDRKCYKCARPMRVTGSRPTFGHGASVLFRCPEGHYLFERLPEIEVLAALS